MFGFGIDAKKQKKFEEATLKFLDENIFTILETMFFRQNAPYTRELGETVRNDLQDDIMAFSNSNDIDEFQHITNIKKIQKLFPFDEDIMHGILGGIMTLLFLKISILHTPVKETYDDIILQIENIKEYY